MKINVNLNIYLTVALLFFLSITSNAMGKINRDTLVCSVMRQNFILVSNGNMHPFSMQFKKYGYFEPLLIYKDIKYGFYEPIESLLHGLYVSPCISKPKTILLDLGKDSFTDIEKVDTLLSSFSGYIPTNMQYLDNSGNQDIIMDTFLLSRELEYSYLFNVVNQEPLLINNEVEELRITYVDKYNIFVRRINIARVIFRDEKAYLYWDLIDTENSQDIKHVKKDSVLLKQKDMELLRRTMSKTNLSELNLLEYEHCYELYYDGYREYEFLIEYKKGDIYNYALVCDLITKELEGDRRYDVISLKSLMSHFYRDYSRISIIQWLLGR